MAAAASTDTDSAILRMRRILSSIQTTSDRKEQDTLVQEFDRECQLSIQVGGVFFVDGTKLRDACLVAVGFDEFAGLFANSKLSPEILNQFAPLLMSLHFQGGSATRSKIKAEGRLIEDTWQRMIHAIERNADLRTAINYKSLCAWIDDRTALTRVMADALKSESLNFLRYTIDEWRKAIEYLPYFQDLLDAAKETAKRVPPLYDPGSSRLAFLRVSSTEELVAQGQQKSLDNQRAMINAMQHFLKAMARDPEAAKIMRETLTSPEYAKIFSEVNQKTALVEALTLARTATETKSAFSQLHSLLNNPDRVYFDQRPTQEQFITMGGIETLFSLDSSGNEEDLSHLFRDLCKWFDDEDICKKITDRGLLEQFINYFKSQSGLSWEAKTPILISILSCLEAWGASDEKITEKLANDSQFIDQVTELFILGASKKPEVTEAAMSLLITLLPFNSKIANRLIERDVLAALIQYYNRLAYQPKSLIGILLFIVTMSQYCGLEYFTTTYPTLNTPKAGHDLKYWYAKMTRDFFEAWQILGLQASSRREKPLVAALFLSSESSEADESELPAEAGGGGGASNYVPAPAPK